MGEVYRARDTKLDRDVAPDPQAIPMERLMTTLNPPISIFVVVAVAMLGSTVQAQSSGAGQMVSVNGMEMYYETHGDGAPLVLLHGITRECPTGSRKSAAMVNTSYPTFCISAMLSSSRSRCAFSIQRCS